MSAAVLGKRVLVVEDEALVAMMVEDMLADFGAAEIRIAGNVPEALKLTQTWAFDAAIVDVDLNGARCTPIAEALRARSVPFAYATGYGEIGADADAAAPILGKPYTAEQLAVVLEKLLA